MYVNTLWLIFPSPFKTQLLLYENTNNLIDFNLNLDKVFEIDKKLWDVNCQSLSKVGINTKLYSLLYFD